MATRSALRGFKCRSMKARCGNSVDPLSLTDWCDIEPQYYVETDVNQHQCFELRSLIEFLNGRLKQGSTLIDPTNRTELSPTTLILLCAQYIEMAPLPSPLDEYVFKMLDSVDLEDSIAKQGAQKTQSIEKDIQTPWTCLPEQHTPVRINQGEVECAARYNSATHKHECLWTQSHDKCVALTHAQNKSKFVTLRCGLQHATEHGMSGYDVPDHWCRSLLALRPRVKK